MIELTDFQDRKIYIKPSVIVEITGAPDTAILLPDGNVVNVRESPETIIRKIAETPKTISLPGANSEPS
jgi:uncharacterized protein YlzI (FlbEa/FlbD family)